MKNVIDYVYDHKVLYVFSFLFISIFYLVLFLYDVAVEKMHYATLLCLTFLFAYTLIDFYFYFQKRKQFHYFQSLDYLYSKDLPKPKTCIEKDYYQLLCQLETMHQQLENFSDQQYQDMLDYFTLWAHQIKTPISALRLLIQSEDISRSEMQMQILRIEQYVEMVLNYLKIDHMSSDLRLKHYQLGNIVNEVIKKQATFFVVKKLKLDLEPIDCEILTDEKWISFVIEQIISNALKYTKEGSIHIYERNQVLYIDDTGIGIKEEDLPRVFERGFTGYNGRLDKKASGLGLYLCYQIVKNLGYCISIKSELGKGTIVSIDFHVDELKVE